MQDTRKQVAAVLAGEKDAFAGIVEAHKRLVAHIVFRLVPREIDREDICQDIFLKVYQNLPGFRHGCKMSTWIARIAYNTCLNHIEKKRPVLFEDVAQKGETIDDFAAGSPAPDNWTERREMSAQVCDEIDRLPVTWGLVLSLYHLQDMTYSEIGNMLNLPDGTVKSYLFRARRLLKERLTRRLSGKERCA